MESYKGMELNEPGDPGPWGSREKTNLKFLRDLIEGIETRGYMILQEVLGSSLTVPSGQVFVFFDSASKNLQAKDSNGAVYEIALIPISGGAE